MKNSYQLPQYLWRKSLEKWGRFACLLVIGCALFSCSSHRQLSREEYQTNALVSRKLGVEITKKDNRKLLTEAANWVGVPYRYGGTTKRGTDCSGLTCQIYQRVYQITLPRNSKEQYYGADKSVRRRRLKQGDLVFFSPKRRKKKINHVGIYLKDGRFIHASSSQGVRIDFLADPYWKKNWVKGGRYY